MYHRRAPDSGPPMDVHGEKRGCGLQALHRVAVAGHPILRKTDLQCDELCGSGRVRCNAGQRAPMASSWTSMLFMLMLSYHCSLGRCCGTDPRDHLSFHSISTRQHKRAVAGHPSSRGGLHYRVQQLRLQFVRSVCQQLADQVPRWLTRCSLHRRCRARSQARQLHADTDIAPSLAKSCQQLACANDERPAHASADGICHT